MIKLTDKQQDQINNEIYWAFSCGDDEYTFEELRPDPFVMQVFSDMKSRLCPSLSDNFLIEIKYHDPEIEMLRILEYGLNQ